MQLNISVKVIVESEAEREAVEDFADEHDLALWTEGNTLTLTGAGNHLSKFCKAHGAQD